LVDTDGLLMRVRVHAADIQDRDGAKLVLGGTRRRFPRLRRVWVDRNYRGALIAWAQREAGVTLEVVAPPKGTKGFRVLPRRWVVERSIAWMGRQRRLSKDYEAMTETSEAMIYAAFGGTMVRKLVRRNAS
jgi:putative transposase